MDHRWSVNTSAEASLDKTLPDIVGHPVYRNGCVISWNDHMRTRSCGSSRDHYLFTNVQICAHHASVAIT